MPDERVVLLVESDPNKRDRLGRALEEAKYQVIACPGPIAPTYTCVGSRAGYCPLSEAADVVVLDTWLAGDEVGKGTTAEDLLELYATSGRTIIVLGPAGERRDPFAPGHVVKLDDQADSSEVVDAVWKAPDVEGFVFRAARSRLNAGRSGVLTMGTTGSGR